LVFAASGNSWAALVDVAGSDAKPRSKSAAMVKLKRIFKVPRFVRALSIELLTTGRID
jgi:hypothetical protein